MDYKKYFDDTGLRSTFYRVAAKAIIRDDQGRVLAVADDTGTFELPGGGWEHDEDFETCLRREFQEEMGVEIDHVGDLLFSYRGREDRPHVMLRLAAEATIKSHNFVFDEDEVTEARFVDRDEFLRLNWCGADREVVKYVDKLWPQVEKSNKNR